MSAAPLLKREEVVKWKDSNSPLLRVTWSGELEAELTVMESEGIGFLWVGAIFHITRVDLPDIEVKNGIYRCESNDYVIEVQPRWWNEKIQGKIPEPVDVVIFPGN